MSNMWLRTASLLAAGLLLIAGCGGEEEAAPPPKSDTDSTSSTEIESKSDTDSTSATEIESKSDKVVADDSEPAESEGPGELTIADFEGYLPSDPLEPADPDEEEEAFSPPEAYAGSKTEPSEFQFEEPVRLKAGGEYVKVDAPGYACPTMADVDEDGKPDLVVGQFAQGKMRLFLNIAEKDSDSPQFAAETWIKTGDDAAEVPGVW